MDTTRQTNDQDLVRTLVAQIFDRVMAVQHLQQPIDLTSSPFKEPALKTNDQDLVRTLVAQIFDRVMAVQHLQQPIDLTSSPFKEPALKVCDVICMLNFLK
ncbi:hypothetical protein NADE_006724 [Nannochloris sp. 'desiccata']|nr:hypothetical protein NADE_003000 [Chlorella desiccata (nom. nud.)]KAH7621461.1 hypothetical protein NADE_006724 [Chlorella desiccata (nom. nud.)]